MASNGSSSRAGQVTITLYNGKIRSNLSYIDYAIEHFAPGINAPAVLSGLSARSSNRAVPIVSEQKEVNSPTYLFVESDRDGATTGNDRLGRFANGTAGLLYDSNTRYDPSVSARGETSSSTRRDRSRTRCQGTTALRSTSSFLMSRTDQSGRGHRQVLASRRAGASS
jgi:hypothetical protein